MSPRTCISSKFPGDGCWSKTTVELVCITWQMMNSSRVCWSTARETSCETASANRTSFLELRDAEVFPGGSVGKESACQAADCLQCRRPGFRSLRQEDSLEKKIPWAEEPGGYRQTNNTGVWSQCLSHTGFAPAHGVCAFPVPSFFFNLVFGCTGALLLCVSCL